MLNTIIFISSLSHSSYFQSYLRHLTRLLSFLSLVPAVTDGLTVTRSWRGMSRKQKGESPWSYNQKWWSLSMTTTWSCVWTPTPETPGSLSSGSTAFSVAFLAIHRKTKTTRKSALVGDYVKDGFCLNKSRDKGLAYICSAQSSCFLCFSLPSYSSSFALKRWSW